MRTPFKTIINPKNWFRKKYTGPGREDLFRNLEREDIGNDQYRKTLWKERQAKEEWGFGDKEVVLFNVHSFIANYSSTRLFNEFGYFLHVKNINYIDCTVTFVFKHRFDMRMYTFHIFDFERVLRGCSNMVGMNVESTNYLHRQVAAFIKKKRQ